MVLMQQSNLSLVQGNVRVEGGWMKQLSHWSDSCQCDMTFSVFLPDQKTRTAPLPPVLYYLSGVMLFCLSVFCFIIVKEERQECSKYAFK